MNDLSTRSSLSAQHGDKYWTLAAQYVGPSRGLEKSCGWKLQGYLVLLHAMIVLGGEGLQVESFKKHLRPRTFHGITRILVSSAENMI